MTRFYLCSMGVIASMLVLFLAACSGGGGAAMSALPPATQPATQTAQTQPTTAPLPTVAPTLKIDTAGDSIGYGYGTQNPLTYVWDPVHSFNGVAAKILGATLFDVAQPGSTCDQVANALTGGPLPTLTAPAGDTYPNGPVPSDAMYATLVCGANDVGYGLTDMSAFDRALAALKTAAPHAKIVVVLFPSVYVGKILPSQTPAWRAHETAMAQASGAAVVDMDAIATESADGVHPTQQGAADLGALVAKAL